MKNLIAYATLNIAGTNELINVYSNNSFGEIKENNVVLEHKTKAGFFVKIENRYFKNITEFFAI